MNQPSVNQNKIYHLPLFPNDKTMLPTGKFHVSFSEVNLHGGTDGCSWRHKLKYVDGHIEEGSGDNEHTTFGTTVHSALETWVKTKENHEFDLEDLVEECQETVRKEFDRVGFNPGEVSLVKEWLEPAESFINEIPEWMETEFPGWKLTGAEIDLFENVDGFTNKWFKGFVDLVIRVPKPPKKKNILSNKDGTENNEFIWWILDWKTTSWGWDKRKKQDSFKRMQLALYKHYISIKLGIPLDKIMCGFVLLKRTAKQGNRIELFEVSVGDTTRKNALNFVGSAISQISKGLWTKNRNSCRWCGFYGTELCP